jgi:hypothetical protein
MQPSNELMELAKRLVDEAVAAAALSTGHDSVLPMALSDWAPAIGAMGGAALGAGATLLLYGVSKRRERKTRWDNDTFAAYSSFLEHASAAFGIAQELAGGVGRPVSLERERDFNKAYKRVAAKYEELALLDPSSRDDTRRLLWLLWNLGMRTMPDRLTDLSGATHIYRDARYHVRQRAQTRLGVVVDRHGEPPTTDEYNQPAHGDPLGSPPEDFPYRPGLSRLPAAP